MSPYVLDVSHYQSSVDLDALMADPACAGVIFKATQGVGVDPTFRARWDRAGALGLPRGAYVFEEPDREPRNQADFFVATVRGTATGIRVGDVLVIDCENAGHTGVPVVGHCWTMAQQIKGATGTWPVVYTGPGFWNGLGQPGTKAQIGASCVLWQAQYGPRASPVQGWPNGWWMWQYTSGGQVPAVSGRCDVSRFPSGVGVADGRARFRSQGVGNPPAQTNEEEDDMALTDEDVARIAEACHARFIRFDAAGKPDGIDAQEFDGIQQIRGGNWNDLRWLHEPLAATAAVIIKEITEELAAGNTLDEDTLAAKVAAKLAADLAARLGS